MEEGKRMAITAPSTSEHPVLQFHSAHQQLCGFVPFLKNVTNQMVIFANIRRYGRRCCGLFE